MESKSKMMSVKTPKEIKEELDKYIIGQDDAKKTLSVAIYNHYKRIFSQLNDNNTNIDKSNIIISGPTGCGKSTMIKMIAKMIGVPCYIADATSITQAGYVGDDVESILVGLLRECNYDIRKAEIGIVCLDEIDKLAKRNSNENITRDVVGEGVQQALLKMIEGGIVSVPPEGGRKHPEQELIYINTTNILFIGTGAFVGLDDIIKKRMNTGAENIRKKIDFNNKEIKVNSSKETKSNFYKYAEPQDYKKFGLIPEFIGRFPILSYIDPLDENALAEILIKPENSIISQYKELFLMDGIKLEITPAAIKEIAKQAKEKETGARALRGIMETVLMDYMFETPGGKTEKIKIDKKTIIKKLSSIDDK